jgi:hypothetical protein
MKKGISLKSFSVLMGLLIAWSGFAPSALIGSERGAGDSCACGGLGDRDCKDYGNNPDNCTDTYKVCLDGTTGTCMCTKPSCLQDCNTQNCTDHPNRVKCD